MPPRAFATQVVQLGKETTPGTPVAANTRLQAMRIMPKPTFESERFAPSGYTAPTVSIPLQEWTEADVEGRATYTDADPVFAGAIGKPVVTTPSGGTLARQRVYTFDGVTPANPEIYTVEYGDTTLSRRFSHGMFNGLSMSIARDSLEFNSAMIARNVETNVSLSGNEVQTVTLTGATGGTFTLTFGGQTTANIAYNATAAAVATALAALTSIGTGNVAVTGAAGGPYVITFQGTLGNTDVALLTASGALLTGTTPTVVPTETTKGGFTLITPVPIAAGQWDIYVDDSAANLGTTKFLEAYEAEFELAERFEPTWTINSALPSFTSYVEKSAEDQEHTGTLNVGASTSMESYLTTMRTGAKKFVRLQAIGPIIEGAITHKLTIDMCVFITGTPGYDDLNGLLVLPFEFQVGRDEVWGKALTVTTVNGIAT